MQMLCRSSVWSYKATQRYTGSTVLQVELSYLACHSALKLSYGDVYFATIPSLIPRPLVEGLGTMQTSSTQNGGYVY